MPVGRRSASGARRRSPVADVATGFVRLQMPFDCIGDEAHERFDELFAVLSNVVAETGWMVYDPQDASPVPVDEKGRQSTLEIYLSVMDQLRPGRTPA